MKINSLFLYNWLGLSFRSLDSLRHLARVLWLALDSLDAVRVSRFSIGQEAVIISIVFSLYGPFFIIVRQLLANRSASVAFFPLYDTSDV